MFQTYIYQYIVIKLIATLKNWTLNQSYDCLKRCNNNHIIDILLPNNEKLLSKKSLYRYNKHPRVQQYVERLLKRSIKSNITPNTLRITPIDMTRLEVNPRDHLANYGFDSKGTFYGYKLHLLITSDGTVLSFAVSRASNRETEFTKRLFCRIANIIRRNVKHIKYIPADAAYDAHHTHDEAHSYLGAVLVAPVNSRSSVEPYGDFLSNT